ncbi:adenosine receptor A2b-like [Dendropsophus ebraccatus]|uniref:adenosine receptor A2b-like n=1 Tax=Dendropsophus ebraccatus TaxID=150705 RepID=UPI0038318B3A
MHSLNFRRYLSLLLVEDQSCYEIPAFVIDDCTIWTMDDNIPFVFLEITLALSIVILNLLVCATVYLHKELRTATNFLIVSLAAADIGVGALAIPFSIVLSMEYTLCFYTCIFITCFPLVTTQFSILLLLLIAINAHLKIRLPNSYTVYVTNRRLVLAVVVCLFLSGLIGFSPMMGWNQFQQYVGINKSHIASERSFFAFERSLVIYPAPFQPRDLSRAYFSHKVVATNTSNIQGNHLGCCSLTAVFSPEYLVYFVFFGCTLLPLLIMLTIYGDIFRVVRGHLRTSKKREAHMAWTLLLLVGIFCFCWMPLNTINSLRLLCQSCTLPVSLIRLAVIFSHMNSFANPLVYAMRKKNFGVALRSVVLRLVQCCKSPKVVSRNHKIYPQDV